MQNYLDVLNNVQQQAVTTTDGPALVIAGAGSGKTRVLTYRIAHLLASGVPPYRILSLTFTNKAAREMKHRIAEVVGEAVAGGLWMGTFHSIFARILRNEAQHLGYPSSFTIYDTADSKSVIKGIMKEMGLKDKVYKPGDVLSRISSAKNDLVTPAAYARDTNRVEQDKRSGKGLIFEIYMRYMRNCYKAGAMDFDDILLNINILFRDYPEVLDKYRSRFSYIMVDEYQDTNYSQYLIIKKLAESHKNICVVGDDAQSIYSFRGAKIENILNFKNDYPEYHLFKLEQNYRSTQTIVNAANSIIKHNVGQIQKDVFSEKEVGSPIKLIKAYSDIEEAFLVVSDIMDKRMRGDYSLDDFAILYRTNSQSRVFEEALRKQSMTYRIYGGQTFYQRKEIKDLLSYFRLTVNTSDQEALKRVINYPARGIGATTLDKLEEMATQTNQSIWNLMASPMGLPGFNAGTLKKLGGFITLITAFQYQLDKMEAFELATLIAKQSGLIDELSGEKNTEGLDRLENVNELLNAVKDFSEQKKERGEPGSLTDFLIEVALLTDQDTKEDDNSARVTMMTVHSAKGLEFKNVYVVGMEEELFPSKWSNESPAALEEERRLFYVAITRAQENAIISYAGSRYKNGESVFCRPSRFITDVDPQYIASSDGLGLSGGTMGGFKTASSGSPRFNNLGKNSDKFSKKYSFSNPPMNVKKEFNLSSAGETNLSLTEGMQVEHERFGLGTVEKVEGSGSDAKATIFFNSTGSKQLLLKFAKLKILG